MACEICDKDLQRQTYPDPMECDKCHVMIEGLSKRFMCGDLKCAFHVCDTCSAAVRKRDRVQGATPVREGKRGRPGGGGGVNEEEDTH
eukprot:9529020-Karenia_brevis.AAC.1